MIEVKNISHHYSDVVAVDDVSISIGTGETVVLRGPSGCGKTTLLMAIGGMRRPTSGSVHVDDIDLYGIEASKRASIRSSHIGFVFQLFHLVPYLSILDNVLLASSMPGNQTEQARAIIDRLGLTSRVNHKPAKLSAGERQRAAIARALINNPKVILADEPTGNLDPENAAVVYQLLADFRDRGGAVVIATHCREIETHSDREIALRAGRIEMKSSSSAIHV